MSNVLPTGEPVRRRRRTRTAVAAAGLAAAGITVGSLVAFGGAAQAAGTTTPSPKPAAAKPAAAKPAAAKPAAVTASDKFGPAVVAALGSSYRVGQEAVTINSRHTAAALEWDNFTLSKGSQADAVEIDASRWSKEQAASILQPNNCGFEICTVKHVGAYTVILTSNPADHSGASATVIRPDHWVVQGSISAPAGSSRALLDAPGLVAVLTSTPVQRQLTVVAGLLG